MRKLLEKRVSIKSILLCILILAVAATSAAAASSVISATLSPDVTVKYNGATQSLKNALGEPVYPIIYNGTTYLPVRALADLLRVAVDWDAGTRTVILGEKGEARLVDVCENRTSGFKYADKMSSAIELPGADVTRTFQSAIRVNSVNSAAKSGVFQLNGAFTTMKTSFYAQDKDEVNTSYTYTMRIFDNDKELLLAEKEVAGGHVLEVTDIQIAGVKNLRFEAVGPGGGDGIAYFLDPTVK